MANVLVLYPELFNCYPKFAKKLRRITSSLDVINLFFLNDPNGFIERLYNEDISKMQSTKIQELTLDAITHAVVFDDGEEFSEETKILRDANISLRVIKIRITRVINLKHEPEYNSAKSTPNYEYIGRGSYWGNPYSMYEEGDTREEVIRKFKYDFDYDKFPNKEKSKVYILAGKRLGCYCKPQDCHGDVLAEYLNSWDDGE